MDGTDVSLVARARDGDGDAFRELVERHGRGVFRLSYRLTGNEEDAQDVAQETFIKAYRNLSRFQEKAELTSWLYRIAANCAYDVLRKRKRSPLEATRRTDGPEPDAASDAPSPHRAAEAGEISRRLARAMTRLSAAERTAFVLRHQEGRTVAEVASALGIRTGAAKTCIFRAVAKLRADLAEVAR